MERLQRRSLMESLGTCLPLGSSFTFYGKVRPVFHILKLFNQHMKLSRTLGVFVQVPSPPIPRDVAT